MAWLSKLFSKNKTNAVSSPSQESITNHRGGVHSNRAPSAPRPQGARIPQNAGGPGNGWAENGWGRDATHKSQTVNVILFGETGCGKSAVVNLIAQEELTKVSPDADPCTMKSTRHNISFDSSVNFNIFDTVGLNEPVLDGRSHLAAMESGYQLILDLEKAGGIHLLLCCMRGGRLTATTQNNYRLFHDFFCQARVPAAVVITGLEWEEGHMERWWENNKKGVEDKIEFVGHACVTTAAEHTDRYRESQQTIRKVLMNCHRKDGAVQLDATDWLVTAGAQMSEITKGKKPAKKEVTRVLSKHLRMDKRKVQEVINMMESCRTSSK